ncbi:hypothetical protein [Methylobacterium sp. 77]|uniref:hypothetical protein n=1 Tax=Methylobacterium sp. 77 TaxID=1101192 RepID=UPI0003A6896C|nr:hypothetical protein [Methylobacterium sp. 77]
MSRQANVFAIEPSCRQYGGPDLGRDSERSTIRVDGSAAYTDITRGSTEGYRFSPGLKP